MRATAYEKLMEAMKLLASAGLPLLAEEVEELALQVDLQATDSGRAQYTLRQWIRRSSKTLNEMLDELDLEMEALD